MTIPEYTTVVGVDKKHLEQLSWTWPTWKKHKPSLLEHPMIVFYDWTQVEMHEIVDIVDHPNLLIQPWPNEERIKYAGDGTDKWSNPQRHKMLAGFVYVPAIYVETPYWLKLDTDVVAIGNDDWIDPKWFEDKPDIVSHPWSFTKPPNQILEFDKWAEQCKDVSILLDNTVPLNLAPKPKSDRVGHKRIISWCGFFSNNLTDDCVHLSIITCGRLQIPFPTQDGLMWYIAKRLGLGIHRANMKKRGWEHWSTNWNVREKSKRAMSLEQENG